jgi:23S rRNA (cytidine1920-2'-O)/16S rRNA (cytidine1409-2'-O)-methyltransferase
MTRLDIWLVEEGKFSSRQAAKRAIKAGQVIINGKPAKPSTQVKGREAIEISRDASDLPVGYTKLKQLDNKSEIDLVKPRDLVLDIGSSAGGFLSYLAEKGATAIGIEVAKVFEKKLKSIIEEHPRLSLIMGDTFFINPFDICSEKELDLLLVDVTTDLDGTLSLVERFSPLLKKGGKLVVALKIKEITSSHLDKISHLGYYKIQVIRLDKIRQEIHLIAFRQ